MVDSTGPERVQAHLHLLHLLQRSCPPAVLVIRHLAMVLSMGISSRPLFVEGAIRTPLHLPVKTIRHVAVLPHQWQL